MIRSTCLLAVPLLAACVASAPAGLAGPEPTGDPLADNALLLAASEAADGPQARAPLIARLDASGVRAADDAADDPLADWRREAAAGRDAPVYRGRALGPAYRRATIAAGATMRFQQIFLAGQRAEIAAAANGATALTLSVRNQKETAVCSQAFAPAATCRWLPIFTERYSIELANKGEAPASVYLVFK